MVDLWTALAEANQVFPLDDSAEHRIAHLRLPWLMSRPSPPTDPVTRSTRSPHRCSPAGTGPPPPSPRRSTAGRHRRPVRAGRLDRAAGPSTWPTAPCAGPWPARPAPGWSAAPSARPASVLSVSCRVGDGTLGVEPQRRRGDAGGRGGRGHHPAGLVTRRRLPHHRVRAPLPGGRGLRPAGALPRRRWRRCGSPPAPRRRSTPRPRWPACCATSSERRARTRAASVGRRDDPARQGAGRPAVELHRHAGDEGGPVAALGPPEAGAVAGQVARRTRRRRSGARRGRTRRGRRWLRARRRPGRGSRTPRPGAR